MGWNEIDLKNFFSSAEVSIESYKDFNCVKARVDLTIKVDLDPDKQWSNGDIAHVVAEKLFDSSSMEISKVKFTKDLLERHKRKISESIFNFITGEKNER